jgi:very-long-chain enoyl-CoA reductase
VKQFVTIGVWVLAQWGNFKTHVILRHLRPEGSTVRHIPKGFGFDLISCPNYFFEITSWLCVTYLSGSFFGKGVFDYKSFSKIESNALTTQ